MYDSCCYRYGRWCLAGGNEVVVMYSIHGTLAPAIASTAVFSGWGWGFLMRFGMRIERFRVLRICSQARWCPAVISSAPPW